MSRLESIHAPKLNDFTDPAEEALWGDEVAVAVNLAADAMASELDALAVCPLNVYFHAEPRGLNFDRFRRQWRFGLRR